MECAHCGRPATIKVTEGNGQVYGLCSPCNIQDELLKEIEFRRNASLLNLVSAEWDRATGYVTGSSPRLNVSPLPPMVFGALNVGGVHVANSNVGVINSGSIGNIANAVGKLRQSGDDEVADALARMTAAVDEFA